MSLLQLNNVQKSYQPGVAVLKDIHFSIERQECVGIVGESGCGKSTLARCILQLDQLDEGEIVFDGVPLQNKSEREIRPYRRHLQTVMQDPASSLNPKLKIRHSLMEPFRQFGAQVSLTHFQHGSEEELARQLMEAVELSPDLLSRYPHELSGGQKQRISIARAISLEPALVVLDEPTSSLDVLTQMSILKLLDHLREALDLSYLLISHDLLAIQALSQKILVMKEGEIVDRFDKGDLFSAERHPYTQQLVSLFD
ncbi:dipeptide/oligopeptide/nickel ABC transporter ATP-binding protein [Planococcus maritimus]|uniref:ABC transporter ATP-binding protein n=1 Tax=Planococcus maritimus TaxID=192421 RepID=UPI00080F26C8|nr:dipeptide/oligopeptide/nickel ABC transporter ATP-binding protein [Planococcus maritimus]ANU15649.1 dipeptide/oligopeptide/nickel ABC transporter ATP-binding protein [Planococcus maritimus]